jgi:hypothetical protein
MEISPQPITRRFGDLVEPIHSQQNNAATRMFGKQPPAGLCAALAPKNALGPALKQIRVSQGWTLADATARLRSVGMGCTVRQLQRIETQQKGIRDFEILYFCSALEVTQDHLAELLNQAMSRRP